MIVYHLQTLGDVLGAHSQYFEFLNNNFFLIFYKFRGKMFHFFLCVMFFYLKEIQKLQM